jgi:hypothetical protein
MHRFRPGWGWSAAAPLSTGHTRERVRRRFNAFLIPMPLLDTPGGGGGGGGEGDDVPLTDELKVSDPSKYYRLYWKRESGAAAAFATRDETKRSLARLAELEKTQMTPEQRKEYDTLKAAQATAEEDRKKKAGEWDALRSDLLKKHEMEITERDQRLAQFERDIAEGEVRRAILAETDYFGGGDGSKTVLVGEMAVRQLGSYVKYEEYDFGGEIGKKRVLITRDASGNIVRNSKSGHPAPFNEAVEGLIASLPEKDHILRGSGKAGSGARGDGVLGDTTKIDLSRRITPEQARDPQVRKQLEEIGGGGLQMGRGFSRIAKATK